MPQYLEKINNLKETMRQNVWALFATLFEVFIKSDLKSNTKRCLIDIKYQLIK